MVAWSPRASRRSLLSPGATVKSVYSHCPAGRQIPSGEEALGWRKLRGATLGLTYDSFLNHGSLSARQDRASQLWMNHHLLGQRSFEYVQQECGTCINHRKSFIRLSPTAS